MAPTTADDRPSAEPSSAAPHEDGLSTDFGWALRALSLAFQASGGHAVASLPGGPRGYLVLVAVAEGRARSQLALALAQRLAIDKTAMTYLLDSLEPGEAIAFRQLLSRLAQGSLEVERPSES